VISKWNSGSVQLLAYKEALQLRQQAGPALRKTKEVAQLRLVELAELSVFAGLPEGTVNSSIQ
jgi:hypothetical protein